VQAAVTPLGADGVEIIPGFLIFNMYTAVGWVIVVLSMLCFVLLLPSFFDERHIATKEAMRKQGISLSLPGIVFKSGLIFVVIKKFFFQTTRMFGNPANWIIWQLSVSSWATLFSCSTFHS
jgi:hypothetical protein